MGGRATLFLLSLAIGGCSQSPGGLPGLSAVDLDVQPGVEGSLDFGTVLAGESAIRTIRLFNQGQDQAAFRVLAPVPPLPDGALISAEPQTEPLDANGTLEISFTLQVPEDAGERSLSGRLDIAIESLSGTPLTRLPVDWGYRVSRSGLVIEPNPLVLGPVAFGATIEGSLTVRNASPEPQNVYSLDRSEGLARFSLGAGDFEGLPAVDERGVWAQLAPGESRSLSFRYTAPPEGSESKEEAIWRIGFCDDPSCQELVRLEGIGANIGPDLLVQPDDRLIFPRVPLGAEVPFEFFFANRGTETVRITSAEIAGAPEAFFFDSDFPLVLEPGESERRTFRFAPPEEGTFSGTLRINNNDPQRPAVFVALSGTGVDLPPCRYSVQPPAIEFLRIPTLAEEIEEVTVRNIGTQSCLLFDIRLNQSSGVPDGTFTLPDGPFSSVIIEPGGTVIIRVAFRPRSMGEFQGTLTMQINSAERPRITVPIEGTGGEGLSIQCSSGIDVTVGETVRLGVFESTTAEIVARRWRIVSAPPGGANTDGLFDPEPPTTAAIAFRPKIIGAYVLEAEVSDAEGRSQSCQAEVTVEPRAFQVTLTWDGPGDLDLHVLRDTGPPWFDQNEDCFFENPSPGWATPGLDNDEDVANGPENIRVDSPVVGQSYRVGVHNFEGGAGRRARLQIYCGDQATPQLDRRSRALVGAASGACTSSSDFWRVAKVTFTAPGRCSVEVVDDYITGSEACTPGS